MAGPNSHWFEEESSGKREWSVHGAKAEMMLVFF